MSMRELLALQHAYADDATDGIAARAMALLPLVASGPLIEPLRLVRRRWSVSADGTPASADEYAIAPVGGAADLQQPPEPDHMASYDFTLHAQTWNAEPEVIEDFVSVYEAAVRRWLAGMRDWSDARPAYGRTLILVQPLVRFESFADFPGRSAVSAGLLCTYTLTERSSE